MPQAAASRPPNLPARMSVGQLANTSLFRGIAGPSPATTLQLRAPVSSQGIFCRLKSVRINAAQKLPETEMGERLRSQTQTTALVEQFFRWTDSG